MFTFPEDFQFLLPKTKRGSPPPLPCHPPKQRHEKTGILCALLWGLFFADWFNSIPGEFNSYLGMYTSASSQGMLRGTAWRSKHGELRGQSRGQTLEGQSFSGFEGKIQVQIWIVQWILVDLFSFSLPSYLREINVNSHLPSDFRFRSTGHTWQVDSNINGFPSDPVTFHVCCAPIVKRCMCLYKSLKQRRIRASQSGKKQAFIPRFEETWQQLGPWWQCS